MSHGTLHFRRCEGTKIKRTDTETTKGFTRLWSCADRSPVSDSSGESLKRAKAAGWVRFRGYDYCRSCQLEPQPCPRCMGGTQKEGCRSCGGAGEIRPKAGSK